ncbi:SAM-dependent methyltransferase [Sphingomonas japonica]|uniref:Cyclopropane-fatty-acyl-phospholipid synthase n=1 Tax=Sphingomonas japonica TaxID=511662 RepID=A0ABX0U8U1_9SPHN|nr:cyclopropane-fatty-acyl-phospholipid synthase family protein [Sphingomonas japonica]NIJ25188.1 cyclopropane-fatty-acyl-phospholipid synthase [Sphingomonas japonica]
MGTILNRGRDAGRARQALAAGIALPLATPLFHRLLDRIDRGLAHGSIEAILPDGSARSLGGRGPGPFTIVELRDWRALWRLATRGSAGWYESWVAGEWVASDLVALFTLFVRNRETLGGAGRAHGWTRRLLRRGHHARRNDLAGARQNIEYHYDLGNDFYRAWLDPGMTYSSARFATPDESLEAAQARKLQAILDRTGTRPGDTILEIGCGWGSFAELAARAGRRVHCLTLSLEQARHVEARMAAAGLDGVTVEVADYRSVTGSYDAVASIEMVEAVGQEYWPEYLATIARVLRPGGRAALQYIAIDDAIFEAYAANVDFIQTYVFPGGMLLSERRFAAIAAQHGLSWKDRDGFGSDYAETCRRWRAAFDRAETEGRLPGDLGRDFRDLWRYYLVYCEGGFLGGGIDVAQVTMIKGE